MFDIRLLESSNNRLSESRQHQNPATEILTAPESGDIQPPSPNVSGPNSGRNWPESDWIWPKWLGSGRIWTDPATDPVGSGGV
jgi:hypothetical protein